MSGGVDMTSAVKCGGELIEAILWLRHDGHRVCCERRSQHTSTVDHADIRGLGTAVL
jgi:hypothetical protein